MTNQENQNDTKNEHSSIRRGNDSKIPYYGMGTSGAVSSSSLDNNGGISGNVDNGGGGAFPPPTLKTGVPSGKDT